MLTSPEPIPKAPLYHHTKQPMLVIAFVWKHTLKKKTLLYPVRWTMSVNGIGD